MSTRALVAIIVVTLVLSPAFDGVLAQTKESGPQIWQKTFEAVWKTVDQKSFDPHFGGVDWSAVRTRYAPQVSAVKSDRELLDLLARMLKELPVSHLSLVEFDALDRILGRSVVNRGVALRGVGGQVVVTRVVSGSSAARAGLRPGFAVTAIDDVPVTTAHDSEAALAGDMKTHRLTVLDETDAVRNITIGYQLPSEDKLTAASTGPVKRYALFESSRVADGVGYIHFTNFTTAVAKKLGPAFDSMKDTRALIIDLRGNSGGDTDAGLALAGRLVEKETQLAIIRTRKGDDYYDRAKPQKNGYRGSVVILLDEESGSESEDVAAGLQEAGRVAIIGARSRGANMDATLQELPMPHLALEYPIGYPRTPKGTIIEGHGVAPDIEVHLTRAGLLRGVDAQLEAAIAYVRK